MKESVFMFKDFIFTLNSLKNAIKEKESYTLLLGESGVGKTTILRILAKFLDKSKYQLLYISYGQATPTDFIRFLAQHFHIPTRNSRIETSKRILQTIKNYPQHIIIFFDEAHYISSNTFNEIRLLLESDLENPSLFSVFFSGLPNLKDRLKSPDLVPLWRRIFTKINLRGLTIEEVRPFLQHCFSKEKLNKISDEICKQIFEQSCGIPGILIFYTQKLLNSFPNINITKDHIFEIIENEE